MRHTLRSILTFACLLGTAAAAQAGTIEFDDGVDGAPIGAFYAGQGVTFVNGSWTDNFGLAGTSGLLGLMHTTAAFQPVVADPIQILFAGGASTVSILATDVGDRGVRLDAYDALVGGSLVDFDQFFGAGLGVGTFITLAGGPATIFRIELYQPNDIASGDGLLFDTLTFEPASVPLPSSALMGIGLLGGAAVALRVRRRRSASIV